MRETFRLTLAGWTGGWPPKPADFKIRYAKQEDMRERHPLNVQPMALFGKPFGNGIDVPDLSADEMREWHRQNGELYLARLGYWWKMSGRMVCKRRGRALGDEEAARVLKLANSEDECYRVFDQWRHGEPLDPKREMPNSFKAVPVPKLQRMDADASDGA